ncbi:MAG: histidinol dehydrogenase, partial [Alistipes sp.]|nr:histidinol dehydrogenase [Alistipes sp.]
GVELDSLKVSDEEFKEAAEKVSPEVKAAIEVARKNITAFHTAQLPREVRVETQPGVVCIQRPVAIRRVGLYIPGGTAPLFSTVLMLALPAKIAGCEEVVLCTPTNKEGKVAAEVLYAAQQCGVTSVYKIGGAQAVAAMAYGTESVPKVDKIFGPGNRYVTLAKQLVSGRNTSIDMPAGPSEVMVMADESADARFVAADLLSQAEHGRDSQAMVVCNSESLAEVVMAEVECQTALLSRGEYIAESLKNSRAVVFESRQEMIDFANAYAAEHLIVSMQDAWSVVDKITAAGSIFVGNYSPESAGDYVSGTNHTLPTSGWAHSCSGVNVDSFMRKMTIQELSKEGLQGLSSTIVAMADAEGLEAHAAAVKVRMEN